MIVQAETDLKTPSQRGGLVVWIWADGEDTQRQGILIRRGLHPTVEKKPTNISGCATWSGLFLRVPATRWVFNPSRWASAELPARSWASWRAFHPDEPDEKYDHDWSWYQNIQAAPLYRRDLDLVAIAPGGEVAAFTTIWYDDVTRCGVFSQSAPCRSTSDVGWLDRFCVKVCGV